MQGSSQVKIFFRQLIPIVAKTLFQELERLNWDHEKRFLMRLLYAKGRSHT